MRQRWRLLFAWVLFAAAAWTAYAVVVAAVEGPRGSDPGLYWTSAALLALIGALFAFVGRRQWRQRDS